MYVYADNAATTAMSPAALEATVAALGECYGNPSSLHSVGQAAAERLAEARAVTYGHYGSQCRRRQSKVYTQQSVLPRFHETRFRLRPV